MANAGIIKDSNIKLGPSRIPRLKIELQPYFESLLLTRRQHLKCQKTQVVPDTIDRAFSSTDGPVISRPRSKTALNDSHSGLREATRLPQKTHARTPNQPDMRSWPEMQCDTATSRSPAKCLHPVKLPSRLNQEFASV